MSRLSNLKLSNFRCYTSEKLEGLSGGLIVLSGANGAGKTNILEAISLLSPGRGLRGARAGDIQKNDSDNPWAVSGLVQTRYEQIQLGTGIDPNTEKRTVRINGQNAKGQNALGEYLACVWLTPQMDRLFLDSARERRKFLDRLIFAFDAGHAGRVTRYENALSQRSKLLRDGQHDDTWLGGLENQIAETGIAIAAARLDFVQKLQTACDRADNAHFPLAQLSAFGTLETNLAIHPALEVEDAFKTSLKETRQRDALTGGAKEGSHKSDLIVRYAEKNMPADQCSTGEQKALLIGIILAHANLIKAEKDRPPLILLDEVAAHLDEVRRCALYEVLQKIGAQTFLTVTDENLFDAVRGVAQFFEVRDARVNRVQDHPV